MIPHDAQSERRRVDDRNRDCGGFCHGASIAPRLRLAPRQATSSGSADGPAVPTGQPVPGRLRIWRDGMEATTDQVVFTLDQISDAEALGEPFSPEDAATITGTFSVDDGGAWKVTGAFSAGYCPRLNTFFVCE